MSSSESFSFPKFSSINDIKRNAVEIHKCSCIVLVYFVVFICCCDFCVTKPISCHTQNIKVHIWHNKLLHEFWVDWSYLINLTIITLRKQIYINTQSEFHILLTWLRPFILIQNSQKKCHQWECCRNTYMQLNFIVVVGIFFNLVIH